MYDALELLNTEHPEALLLFIFGTSTHAGYIAGMQASCTQDDEGPLNPTPQ